MDFLQANLFRIFSLSLVTFFVFCGAAQSSDELRNRLHALLPGSLSYQESGVAITTQMSVLDLMESRAGD
jgi:hypothetical protein